MALTFNNDNFKKEVLDYDGVALVDFWAPWCGPCRMIGPVIEELSKEYEGKAKIGKVNTDENLTISSNYNIMSIPTLLIFKNGKVADQLVGAQSKQAIKSKLDKQIS